MIDNYFQQYLEFCLMGFRQHDTRKREHMIVDGDQVDGQATEVPENFYIKMLRGDRNWGKVEAT